MAGDQTLDPVTFEVLKNSFITSVDQMGEQILRTCYSFVIYNHDFSSGLHDARGECAAQGNQDIAVHVGTLHFTCKAVMRAFEGDMHEGDVFAINDPYAGGTHFSDVRLVRPIFADGEIIAYAQSNGHWSDMGGSVPGSFDVSARDMFREGLRITPVRLFDKGVLRRDVANMIAANTRDPASIIGDIQAQAEATAVCGREILRLVAKYGRQTVETGLAEVQDYVERAVRQRIAALPDGTWETVDFIDRDPAGGEGMIPIRIKMTIKGDKAIYDFTGSHPVIGSIYNSAFGATFSAVAAGMKTFFPDLPLNSGFYRAFEIVAPEGSIVDAKWPVAVTGFLMPFEKIMNSIYEMWSQLMPERALACAFNLEYLLTGGRDARMSDKPIFMFYDWLPGGWGGRNGKDGANVTTACFGTGMMAQPVEGQERANPILTTECEILKDSGGPGRWRGGVGVVKTSRMLAAEETVISYICDRERAVVWGIEGGLPSSPHGLTLTRAGSTKEERLGTIFSDVAIGTDDVFSRPTAGGGGFGDPLERDPALVLEDVKDDYVSVERAAKDYGVAIRVIDAELCDYAIDAAATERLRAEIRAGRAGWARVDPESVARRYRDGEIDALDAIRRHAVILDWGTGEVLPESTRQFREVFERRSVAKWAPA
ncbi:N-methylhydantoinase [Aureimonas endophytica]|uniref:N-methylhydantoinase n=1 Tax=Aureimonas endophytica TaxID=2027858 RepID=A0A916ZPA8_9HYPH|nr:hydantoinase B/oxoprolinase family protein [Aureimonas endophytica]GGE07494.1 N-methylhydantoinase [Aureimonas endophytica]